ncbi:MAG: SufE family protein [Calditrichia bacterium]
MSLSEELSRFNMLDDRDFKLELLLDFAGKLPPVPQHLMDADDRSNHKVHECLTPVSLWTELQDGKVYIHADVPRESPTVRGFISLLIKGLSGATPQEVADGPTNPLHDSGLAPILGMNRQQGLAAIYQRIRREVAALTI